MKFFHVTHALKIFAGSFLSTIAVFAFADQPGRGLTNQFEVYYLKTIIDHHYSSLRITELAAGTEYDITSVISSDDRVHPSPNFIATEPLADSTEIKSISRKNNRIQREEILLAQDVLRKLYGVKYEPRLTQKAQRNIQLLENVQRAEFDIRFIEILSRHYYQAAVLSLNCLVAHDIAHRELQRYCQNVLDSRINDIDHMRELACTSYQRCDIQTQRPLPVF